MWIGGEVDRVESLLTFLQSLQLLLHLSHFLLELLLFFLLDVVLREHIKVDLGYFLILAVELIQLFDGV